MKIKFIFLAATLLSTSAFASSIETSNGAEFMSLEDQSSWSCVIRCTFRPDLPNVLGTATASTSEQAFNSAREKCIDEAKNNYPEVAENAEGIYVFGEVINGKPRPARIQTDCVKN